MADIVRARGSDVGADRFVKVVAGLGGISLLAFGVWAMAAPRSFFDELATFEPYNQHFLQDIGAFQIGLGAVLLLALVRSDALAVALLGVGIGLFAHTVSHLLGIDLGGKPAVDIPFFALLAGLTLAAGAIRARRGTSSSGSPAPTPSA